MVAMTVASTDFQLDRPLTVDDLDLIQDDGHRYELDDGILVMFPAPIFRAVKPFVCEIVPASLVAGPWTA